MYTDKVYTGLDHAPAAFDLRGRILGPNGNNLDYIKSETGAVVILKGGASPSEPLHLVLQHSRTDGVSAARSLALNLIETVKNELAQLTAQTGQTVQTGVPVVQTALPAAPATAETPDTSNIAPANIAPAVAVSNAPVVAVRPQTVLQFMPQQQYILNQDGSQLIPLIQGGGPMSGPGNFTQLTALPLGPGAIGSFPQSSMGATQFVDANLQPVSMAQFRFSVPNTMPTFIQNGLALSQVSLANQDNTTVSYTSLLPVSSTGSSPPASTAPATTPTTPQKTDKPQETQVNFAAGDQVLTMPASSQTMYIPYHQLQDLTSSHNGGTIQHQFVSIGGSGMNAWATGTSLPLSQITQLPPGTALNPNILQLNQKPSANTSIINLWSAPPGGQSLTQIAPTPQIITPTGQVWSGQQMQISASQGTTLTPIPPNTPWVRAPASIAAALPQGAELIPLNSPANTLPKGVLTQEVRGQKRMSDGTPTNQIQLRPIAPAGSQTTAQDKSNRDVRWATTMGRESGSSANHSAAKGSTRNSSSNISSTQNSTGTMTISARDRTLSPARTTDKTTTQTIQDISSKTLDPSSKNQSLTSNIQMYAVSNNMQGMQNLTPIPSSLNHSNGQLNHMYIVPSSQTMQNVGLSQNAMMGQTLQVGQGNVPMIQPNQLSLPQGVQYSTVPLVQLPQQMQYITPGLNLSNPATAQQLSLAMPGQQILNPAMLSTLHSSNPQLAQLNSPTIQSLQSQMLPGSPNSNLQYSATPIQTITQPPQQFIPHNSQQQMLGNTSETYVVPTSQYTETPQIPPQSNTIVMSSQNSLSQQYAPVNQQSTLNPTVMSGDSRNIIPNANQQTSYPTTNTPNSTNISQQTSFPSGIPQQYATSPSIAHVATQQVYPSSGSPSSHPVLSIPADNPTVQQATLFPANADGYPQSNTPTNTYQSVNSTQTAPSSPYAGNQYSVPSNNRTWVGQRFGTVPPGNVAQYNVPSRNGHPPPPGGQTANSNYWQYS